MHSTEPINISNKKAVFRSAAPPQATADSSVDTDPFISIIVPVLQEEKILEKTLKSYAPDLLRKYNAELVVSDGGSSDQSVNIARKYTDRIIIHDADYRQTISEGRNRGAEIARGKCLVFINGDTVPQDTETFLSHISQWYKGETKYSNADALACPVNVEPGQRKLQDKIFYTSHNFYVKLLNSIGVGMGRGECQIVRRDIFDKVGGYNSSIAAGEDFDLYRRINNEGKIAFARDITVYESPRRFRRYGYIPIIWSWTLNSLSVMLRGKSVSKEWEAVR